MSDRVKVVKVDTYVDVRMTEKEAQEVRALLGRLAGGPVGSLYTELNDALSGAGIERPAFGDLFVVQSNGVIVRRQ